MRVELITLHEADTLYSANPARGVQLCEFCRPSNCVAHILTVDNVLDPSCNQITVTGSGTTPLPAGVAFPGYGSFI